MVEDFLRGFKTSDERPVRIAGPGRNAVDPIVAARNKLIAGIEEHKGFVQAELDGREPKKIAKVVENGVEIEKEQRLIKWYFNNQDGQGWRTFIRYGTSALTFEGGPVIEVGEDKARLLKAYDAVIKAAQQGKLDEHIARARVKTRREVGEDRPRSSPTSREEAAPELQTRFKRSARR